MISNLANLFSLILALGFAPASFANTNESCEISRENAAQNLVAVFANNGFTELVIDEHHLPWYKQQYPLLSDLFQKVDLNTNGDSDKYLGDEYVVRVYGEDVKAYRNAIFAEISRALTGTPKLWEMPWRVGWDSMSPDAYRMGIYVDCYGRVNMEPAY